MTNNNWSVPNSAQHFLGVAGYYHWYVKDFSMIPKPLYQLTECGHEFKWIDECNSEFQEWKLRLISAPMQPSFFSLAHMPERLARLCRCIVTMIRHMGVAHLKMSEGTVSREKNCLCRHRYVAPLVLPLGLTLHSLH